MFLRAVTARAAPQLGFARAPRATAVATVPTLNIAPFRGITLAGGCCLYIDAWSAVVVR